MSPKIQKLTRISLFAAIIVLLGFTPLGFIPLTPAIQATTVHIPVIIGSIILGPAAGLILGFIFGIVSYINNFIRPQVLSIVFLNPLVTFIPRLLIGPVSYYCYRFFRKMKATKFLSAGVSGFAGSFTNTVLVMGMIYIFEAGNFAVAAGIGHDEVLGVIMGVITLNGSIEAIVSCIITSAVISALAALSHINKNL